ncbi:hypothetical protein JXO59_05995, partial [candidate division KSB1 bacterium]|nr:hypothetical protein [candidate division KSB1 bacterium]
MYNTIQIKTRNGLCLIFWKCFFLLNFILWCGRLVFAQTLDYETVLLPDIPIPGIFGQSVDVDGDWAIVGATNEAYIFHFDGNAWVQYSKLIPENDTPSWFGGSVAIDGNTAIVGDFRGMNNNNVNTGCAYVFSMQNNEWKQQAKLIPSSATDRGYFGLSTAIDGNTAIIGAPGIGGDPGAVYIFKFDNNKWKEQRKLSNFPEDEFGSSVDIDGNTIIIGAKYSSGITM